ncbi:MAG: TolC family protein [Spirochaetales bacterium]|nr:TolC family protein [Spirochaetales bacterium]
MVLFLPATALFAEETMTLTVEDSVELALKQNLSLQSSRLDVSSAEVADKYSWNYLMPDFSASAGISGSDSLLESTGFGSETWGVSAGLSASLSLDAASGLARDSARLNLESQNISYESSEDQLVLSVRQEFYYLLAYEENLDLQIKNLDLAEKRYEQVKENFNNGLASQLDVLEARNSYESLRPDYTDAKTTYASQLMSFKNLLGISLNQEIELDGSLDVTLVDLDADELIDSYIAGRLDVQAAVKALEIQDLTLSSLKRSTWSPTVSLGASWNNSASLDAIDDWSDQATLSLNVGIPLSSLIKSSSEQVAVSQAELTSEKLDIELQDTLASAEEEIRTLIMELDGARENMEITELSKELALENFQMTEASFKAGTKELLDVEDAQNKLFEANQSLLVSRYTYLSKLLELENALNTTLENN